MKILPVSRPTIYLIAALVLLIIFPPFVYNKRSGGYRYGVDTVRWVGHHPIWNVEALQIDATPSLEVAFDRPLMLAEVAAILAIYTIVRKRKEAILSSLMS